MGHPQANGANWGKKVWKNGEGFTKMNTLARVTH